MTPWFYLSEYSVGNLTTAILLVVITTYLLAIRDKGIDTWLLTGYIGVLAVLLVSYVIRYSMLHTVALRTGQMSNSIVFGVVFLLGFSYTYRTATFIKEARIVVSGFFLIALAVFVANFVLEGRVPVVYDFGAHYFTHVYGAHTSYVTGLGYIWSAVVLFRKARFHKREAGELQSVRSCRNFGYLIIATLVIAAAYSLSQVQLITRDSYSLVFSSGSLIVCLLIYVVYVGNSSQPTSFRQRLVGITLAAVLVAFGIGNNVLIARADRRIEAAYREDIGRTALLVARDELTILPAAVAYVATANGTILWDDDGSRVELVGRTLTEHRRRSGRSGIDDPEGFYWYGVLDDPTTFFFAYPITSGVGDLEVGFRYADYRESIHEVELDLMFLVIGSTVALLILFPFIFTRTLVRPLSEVLGGVQRMQRRQMGQPVPIQSMDEIGELATQFNALARSLQQAESNFAAMAENANDGIVILDHFGTIRYGNRRLSEISGYPLDELVGLPLTRFASPEELERVTQNLKNRLAGLTVETTYESAILSATGERIPIEVTGARTIWEGENADVVIIRDIRDRKASEEQLQRQREQLVEADKLATLGVLVAGVAHEVSSPTHSIRMNSAFVEEALKRVLPVVDQCIFDEEQEIGENTVLGQMRDRLPQAIQGIDKSAEQIDSVVQSLKGYVKRGSQQPASDVNLNDVVRSVSIIARRFIEGRTTNYRTEFNENLPNVKGRLARLQQVVLNLVENACQSLADRDGTVTVSTDTNPDGSKTILTVTDTGVGIPAENLKRVTERFFTTRESEGGTGLGLSITADIVKEHGGEIRLDSTPGAGTTVAVTFPAVGAEGDRTGTAG